MTDDEFSAFTFGILGALTLGIVVLIAGIVFMLVTGGVR